MSGLEIKEYVGADFKVVSEATNKKTAATTKKLTKSQERRIKTMKEAKK